MFAAQNAEMVMTFMIWGISAVMSVKPAPTGSVR